MNRDVFFYEYENDTGKITRSGVTNSNSWGSYKSSRNLSIVEGKADFYTQYIVNGIPTNRPTFATFDKTSVQVGEDTTLAGLPDPTTVTVNGVTHTVTDGEFILAPTSAGKFTVVVSAWPYLDYSEVITCA